LKPVADHERNQETISRLQTELEQVKAESRTSQMGDRGSVEQLELQLRQSLEENARLRNELAETDQRLLESVRQPMGEGVSQERMQEVTDIVQELRQPMASIIGYTDLLLEVDRHPGSVAAYQGWVAPLNVWRLLDDMIQFVSMEENARQLRSNRWTHPIDGAVADSMVRLRERVSSRVWLLDSSRRYGDHDALQQYRKPAAECREATPPDGEIALHASIEGRDNELGMCCFKSLIRRRKSVEDLPRFSRLYRTDNALSAVFEIMGWVLSGKDAG
jgi:signal transduction histidine kinase